MSHEHIAFFDVDNTISKINTAFAFILVCMYRGYLKFWYLLGAPFLFLLYRVFKLDMEFVYRLTLPRLYGVTRAEFEDISKEAFSKFIKPKLYQGALKEISQLRAKNIRVILATSSPFEVVYPLALHCGIAASDLVATQFAYTDGVFDGKLMGVPVYSRYKFSIINNFIQKSNTDLQACSFYTDSIHDLPLLEKVGNPVAANPDHRLKRIAKKKGWPIKDFSK